MYILFLKISCLQIMGAAIALIGFIGSAEEILRNLMMQLSPYLSWFDGPSSRVPPSTLSSSSISPPASAIGSKNLFNFDDFFPKNKLLTYTSIYIADCIGANDHVDKLRSTTMKTIPGWTHNLNGGSVRDQHDATCLAGNREVHSHQVLLAQG